MRLRLVCVLFAFAACPPSTSRPDGSTGQPPTVTSISPTMGPITGGTSVTVNGSRFEDGATVRFGDANGTQVVVQNALRLTVRTPAVPNAGRVALIVTNPDGTSGRLDDAFTFEGVAARQITEARLRSPAELIDRTGNAMVTAAISAEVEVPSVTRGTGQGMGVRAQLGFATTVSSPPAQSDFTWSDATYQSDANGSMAGDLARDIYGGMISVPGTTQGSRTYTLAARFSTDNGATWQLADRDGIAGGVSQAQLTRLVVEPKGVEWCRMGGRSPASAPPTVMLRGSQTGPIVYAQVFVTGRTEAAGMGTGIKGQVGYGPIGAAPSTWTWVDGTYNVDVGNNDEWQATLPNPGEGTYRFAFRFTLDDGLATYCDSDGLGVNDFTEEQTGTLVVSPPGVDRCVLQFPSSAQALVGAPGGTVFGRVFAAGITDSFDGGAPGVTMELGLGPGGVQPDQSSWTWSAGAVNVPVSGGGLEFQATLPGQARGTYAFAWRARVGTGAFTYCDLNGSQDGFQTNQAGVFAVAPFSFSECRLQFPATLTAYEGRPSAMVYGQVYAPGVTTNLGDAGPPSTLEAQLGVGPNGSDPADAGWSWTPTSFNVSVVGGGVEYQGSFVAPSPGAYDYAYRARYQGGEWAFCDRDGTSTNGYEASQAGELTVRPFDIDECVVETGPLATTPATQAGPFAARVRVSTLTEAPGQGSGVTAELGYGPVGTSPSSWTTWAPATFDGDAMAFDRYAAAFTAPGTAQTVEVAFRFRLGAQPFVYCDRDGLMNGYSSSQASTLTVTSAVCQLEAPSAFLLESGSPLTARVTVSALGTADAGPAPGLRAQLGLGARDDASSSPLWGWGEASYVSDAVGRDVYGLTFFPSYTGPRAVSARVSTDDGGTWTYCDLNGSNVNGYEVTQQYDVTVTEHTGLQFCKLQFPASVSRSAGTTRVYGQLYQAGLTPDSGAPVRAEFGVGARDRDPALAWAWSPASFVGFGLPPSMDNNNEYAFDYAPDGGAPHYAFRFSINDGGSWCYADLDGHGANGAGQPWSGFRGDLNGPVNLGEVVP